MKTAPILVALALFSPSTLIAQETVPFQAGYLRGRS